MIKFRHSNRGETGLFPEIRYSGTPLCSLQDRHNLHMQFFDDVDSYRDRTLKTPQQLFLEKSEASIPWKALLMTLEPHYYKGKVERSRIPLEIMVRIAFLQRWYQLSDSETRDALYDYIPLRYFAKLRLNKMPGAAAIRGFRLWLQKNDLEKVLLAYSEQLLARQGIRIKPDAEGVSSPLPRLGL